MTSSPDQGHAAPVRLLPYLPVVLDLGLRVVLAPHAHRVDVVSTPSEQPDLIVFDPMHDGVEDRLARSPRVPLVAMSGACGAVVVARARHYGASRVLELGCPADALVSMFEEAAADVGRSRSGAHEPRVPTFDGTLSAREAEVVALVCQGLTNQEISAELFLGHNTIKTYIRTAYRKMGVTSRSQAVLWGLARGGGGVGGPG
jgi:NarL family two-component system response regulator LiaR